MAKANPAADVKEPGLCCASVVETPLTHPDATNLAHVLAALADPVRLQLFSIVAAQGEVCSCDLEAPLGRSQPTISHHTKLLAEAGLIERGFSRVYLMTSQPPKLTADFGDDASEERIDEMMSFLRTVPHCEVRLGHPGQHESP